jgi:hypothetical protein
VRTRRAAKEVAFWVMVSTSLCLMGYTVVRDEVAKRRRPELRAEIQNGANVGGLPVTDVGGAESTIPSRGRYLVSILDTGCGPCQQQATALSKMGKLQEYSGVLAVFPDSLSKVQEFASSYEFQFTCLVDAGRGPISKYGISTFPQTLEVNDGVVVRSWVGYHERLE